jgi:integrase
LIEETRQAQVYGVRPQRSFEQAAARFVLENQHKRSLHSDISRLKLLMPWIGTVSLDRLHRGSLEPWVAHRRKEGAKPGTINHGLKLVRRILRLAAGVWVDEFGLTWLLTAPAIPLLPDRGKRAPHPLSHDEERHLLTALPAHLAAMAKFALNSGCRDAEVCHLRWEWEQSIEGLDGSVFVIPGERVKNGEDRLVVLNRVARAVVESQRGAHPEFVFSYRGQPLTRMNNSAWRRGRLNACLARICAEAPEVKGFEEAFQGDGPQVAAAIQELSAGCVGHVTEYTLVELQDERVARGLRPLSSQAVRSGDLRNELRERAVLRHIDKHWPKHRAFARLRVHDLKHTFGRRLRAAGVGFEDRQDLLGHRSRSVTTHYSAVELTRLLEAANRICESNGPSKRDAAEEKAGTRTAIYQNGIEGELVPRSASHESRRASRLGDGPRFDAGN